jgi:RNA polymerase sigma factor (sigma-70 family)
VAEVEQDFQLLIQRMRDGSEEAARELYVRYGGHIRRIVRRTPNKKLRSTSDSSAFVQAVWATFFADQHSPQLDNPEAFKAFLGQVARNKVVEVFRQRHTEKYNIDREHSLDGSAACQATRVPAPQPTPSQVAVAKERWNEMVNQLPAHQQGILDLARQGDNYKEIAAKLGVNERTVRRVISKLAKGKQAHEEPSESPPPRRGESGFRAE